MDTGTHIVMGIALGGLATLDPIVANDPITAQTVLIGTLIGSQAPDFDTITKLKNNAVYLRNHRGITHSIPAVLLWPILVSSLLFWLNPDVNSIHLWLWTFLSVVLHVFVDLFNAYGTQALRPFSKKWIGLGIINTFDPFIFFSHIFAILIWRFAGHPGITMAVLYSILTAYYIWRTIEQKRVLKAVRQTIPNITRILISPTYQWNRWHLAIKTTDTLYVAKAKNRKIEILDSFDKAPIPSNDIIDAAKQDENLSAFLSFSKIYHWEIDTYEHMYEVRLIDLRYLSKGYYPFVAIVQLDKNLNCISSFTGWVFSEERLRKKLVLLPN